jgi:uncharacterized protein (DUF1778 family)
VTNGPIRRRPRSIRSKGKGIHIYLAEAEKAMIYEAAARQGITASQFCAQHLLRAARRVLKRTS